MRLSGYYIWRATRRVGFLGRECIVSNIQLIDTFGNVSNFASVYVYVVFHKCLSYIFKTKQQHTKMGLTFSVTVFVHKDGTLSITDSDIKGLIIEVSTLHELLTELQRVASRLLQSNHGLTSEEVEQAELILDAKLFTDTVRKQKNSSFPSLRGVSWGDNKHANSLQYA